MSSERTYEGQELDLFAHAHNWKAYWGGKIAPYLGKHVLEVGAGLGSNTALLLGPRQESWLCLEPDPGLSARVPETLAGHPQAALVRNQTGTLRDLPEEEAFDTIFYIDVLEHIEDDHAEMQAAMARLRPGGKIIILSPAHPALYTEFDRAIGHYRRYTRKTLKACTPPGSTLVRMFALDSVGLMASVANKLLLHQSMPSLPQIQMWDRWMVPASRLTDPLIGFSLGKSLIGIWQKSG